MKIKFSENYCGRETAMKEYKQGEIVELDFIQASELIRVGAAVEVLPEVEKPKRKYKEVTDGENAQ